VHDLDAVGQGQRHLRLVAHRERYRGEEVLEKPQVAFQQRDAGEAQQALVAPHASRLPAGEHDADGHLLRVFPAILHHGAGV
jgi:hypothetical protein